MYNPFCMSESSMANYILYFYVLREQPLNTYAIGKEQSEQTPAEK